MKFERVKVSALSGNTEVRFTEVSDKENRFIIIADKSGIRFHGTSEVIMDISQLEAFAQVVSKAWTEHSKLKPKLTLSQTEH